MGARIRRTYFLHPGQSSCDTWLNGRMKNALCHFESESQQVIADRWIFGSSDLLCVQRSKYQEAGRGANFNRQSILNSGQWSMQAVSFPRLIPCYEYIVRCLCGAMLHQKHLDNGCGCRLVTVPGLSTDTGLLDLLVESDP